MTTISYDPTTRAWHEYTPHGRIPIPGQRLARLAPTATPQGAQVDFVDWVEVWDENHGPVLFAGMCGVLAVLFGLTWLVKELLA